MTEFTLDEQVAAWRAAMLRSRAVTDADADELEEHLRDQVADLSTAGLSDEEAFLIAVKRLGQVDALTAEYAREHGDRLWKQLVTPASASAAGERDSVWTMILFSAIAVVLLHTARLLAVDNSTGTYFLAEPLSAWFGRSLSLFVLPVLGAYFAYTRRASRLRVLIVGGITLAIALTVNLFPYAPESSTNALVALHLPILLWFLIGAVYVGDLRSAGARMDFVRFSGEWLIYFLLIVIGGGVLISLTTLVLSPIMPEAITQIVTWVLPAGGAAAVIVAAWLVEAKKSIIENLAPVLTAIFTPLFAAMLLVTTVIYAATAFGRSFDRNSLGLFDALLVVVVGLVIYGISARSTRRPGLMDALRLTAVVAAVLLDLLVLVAMLARVGEFGFTANRVAALGLNLVLLVDLVVTAVIIIRMLRHRTPVLALERWQTSYLLVIGAWVTAVVLVLPPVFGFA
jgi:hypothetical protein